MRGFTLITEQCRGDFFSFFKSCRYFCGCRICVFSILVGSPQDLFFCLAFERRETYSTVHTIYFGFSSNLFQKPPQQNSLKLLSLSASFCNQFNVSQKSLPVTIFHTLLHCNIVNFSVAERNQYNYNYKYNFNKNILGEVLKRQGRKVELYNITFFSERSKHCTVKR